MQTKGSANVYASECIIRRFREELYRKYVDALLLSFSTFTIKEFSCGLSLHELEDIDYLMILAFHSKEIIKKQLLLVQTIVEKHLL
jgi:hypothetical protein